MIANIHVKIKSGLLNINLPIIFFSETNFSKGIKANGNYIDCKIFKNVSYFLIELSGRNVINTAGTSAKDLVISTLTHNFIFKLRNPSATY